MDQRRGADGCRALEQFVRSVEWARAEGWDTEEILGTEIEGKLGPTDNVRESRE